MNRTETHTDGKHVHSTGRVAEAKTIDFVVVVIDTRRSTPPKIEQIIIYHISAINERPVNVFYYRGRRTKVGTFEWLEY